MFVIHQEILLTSALAQTCLMPGSSMGLRQDQAELESAFERTIEAPASWRALTEQFPDLRCAARDSGAVSVRRPNLA